MSKTIDQIIEHAKRASRPAPWWRPFKRRKRRREIIERLNEAQFLVAFRGGDVDRVNELNREYWT